MPIDLIDTIKPKNNGTFPMVEAEDVVVGKGTADEKRLPEALAEAGKVAAVDTAMPGTPADDHVPSTQLLKELLATKLSLTGGTLTGALTVNATIRAATRLYVNELFSLAGTLFFQVLPSLGFKFPNIHQMVAYGNNTTFMQNESDGVHLYAKTVHEDGQELTDKYALKDHTHDGVYAPQATTYTKAEVDGKLAAKQDKLTAGENVTLTPQGDGTVKIDAEGGEVDWSTLPTNESLIYGETPTGKYWGVSGEFLDYYAQLKGWGGVTVDEALSDTSENPVQNKAVKAYVDGLVGDIKTALAAI